MIRGIRHALAGWPEASVYQPEQHRQAFDKAFWLVRIYYAATLLFAYQEMSPLWRMIQNDGSFSPLWPIFWATDVASAGLTVFLALIGTSLLAVALPDRRWPRVLVFLSFLSASAFHSSFGLGSINHGNHYWLWIGFCFCFLPSGSQANLRSRSMTRYNYLLVFGYTQGLILLFYSMSGFWKVAAGLEALFSDRIGAFHPEGLATIAASKMIQIDRPTILGPWLADHPLVGWPVYLLVVYIELVALWVWFRPCLHRAFGVALAGFHVGTFLLLGISFPKHILVLTILLIWSPFVPDRQDLRAAAFSLPGLGRLFLLVGSRPSPSS